LIEGSLYKKLLELELLLSCKKVQVAGCNFSLQKPQSSSLEKTRKYANIVKKMKTFPEDTKAKAPHFI